jgi:hypothetical protein
MEAIVDDEIAQAGAVLDSRADYDVWVQLAVLWGKSHWG